MVLLTLGDAHVPWRSLFSLHLQCSGSWTQVWDRLQGRPEAAGALVLKWAAGSGLHSCSNAPAFLRTC